MNVAIKPDFGQSSAFTALSLVCPRPLSHIFLVIRERVPGNEKDHVDYLELEVSISKRKVRRSDLILPLGQSYLFNQETLTWVDGDVRVFVSTMVYTNTSQDTNLRLLIAVLICRVLNKH